MDQSKALQRLTEAADLAAMVEELMKGVQAEKVPNTALSGMRVTLRAIRESILSSHDAFAGEMVARSRNRIESNPIIQTTSTPVRGEPSLAETIALSMEASAEDSAKIGLRRRDLRASLEKL